MVQRNQPEQLVGRTKRSRRGGSTTEWIGQGAQSFGQVTTLRGFLRVAQSNPGHPVAILAALSLLIPIRQITKGKSLRGSLNRFPPDPSVITDTGRC